MFANVWRYLTDCLGVKHWKLYKHAGRPEAPGTNMFPCVKPAGFSAKAMAAPLIIGLPLVLPPADGFGAPAFLPLPPIVFPSGGYANNNAIPPIIGNGNFIGGGGFGNFVSPVLNKVPNTSVETNIPNNTSNNIPNIVETPPVYIPPVYIPPVEFPPTTPPISPPVSPPSPPVKTPEPSSISIVLIALLFFLRFKLK